MELSSITINKQSSIRMESDGHVIYFDPIEISDDRHDADVIFVTHDHFDHFSADTIHKLIKKQTILVVPKKMEKTIRNDEMLLEMELQIVEPKQKIQLANGLCFETVPAYNNLKPFHPKHAGWCGYIVIIDGKRYYVAGDTDDTKDNRQVECDVALVPVGGTYTMTAKQAAEFINIIKPKVAIPTHYGELVGDKTAGNTFKELVNQSIDVVIKLNM